MDNLLQSSELYILQSSSASLLFRRKGNLVRHCWTVTDCEFRIAWETSTSQYNKKVIFHRCFYLRFKRKDFFVLFIKWLQVNNQLIAQPIAETKQYMYLWRHTPVWLSQAIPFAHRTGIKELGLYWSGSSQELQ